MRRVLAGLATRGAHPWALSNYSPWLGVMRRRLELDRYFSGYVVSCETGERKPAPGAYAALVQRTGEPASRWVVVDDRRSNVEGARRAGMEGLRFESAAQLEHELRSRGL
jgi:putative hydrolase of the HAD superfamily